MADIPARAERAGARIKRQTRAELGSQGRFDLILIDAPCSGSGSWRRSPEAKWRLTSDRLEELARIQAELLSDLPRLLAGDGRLAYATCSLFHQENQAQMAAFLARHADWELEQERQFTPLDGGDGFYLAVLKRV